MKLLSVQTAKATGMMIEGKRVMTAIRKLPVAGDIVVASLGLAGDEQANPEVHGGLSKAIYAYPSEHYAFWQQARLDAGLGLIDETLPFGSMGENLTLSGLLESDVWIGDVLEFPHCTLRVTEPREPCFKFNAAMGFNTAAKKMAQSGFCGFYLAVDKAGMIAAGDSFQLKAGSRQVGIAASFVRRMGTQRLPNRA
jgi:MOSC domain-containing protein YiiM